MPTPATPQTIPTVTEDVQTGSGDGLEARVIVYNCECHTYQQVIDLFCRFIPGMTSSKAFELAYRIDHEGEAMVYAGGTEQAEEVAAKLAGGGLRVSVQ
jgi:ATP-dependent Clp protease adaptor protein ClpS